ncbi:beta-lactamase class A [Algoriphagus sp. 4150]|uniref:serine hydrolase n=1 Tax=Algoriphagus sp. 4150 TaxID=2817756 RepID=UPI00285554DB|nr:serine hydrolase [Algoriphagus sp. 4150]MDR7127810.1 beta-lactamase class A [Algoriphagus sp. 4150]
MTLYRLLIVFLVITLPIRLQAQTQTDQQLTAYILELVQSFQGDIGIYIEHLESGNVVEINSDSIFPTASIVKIPILLGIFDKIENGELHYHQPLIYHDSIKYGGSGIMQFFKDSTQTDLSTLLALMLSYSDNTTSLWNQALAGGGVQLNQVMDQLGYQNTRVNSRTAGRESIWEKYGWGQTTPKEMAGILVRLNNGELFSPAASEQMYRLLSNTFYTDYAISGIPAGINVASKQGMVNASRSEVFLVNSPRGDYVCAIFTNNNVDQRWDYDNEAWVLTRKLSNLIWNYFNPQQPYSQPEEIGKYLEGQPY